MFNGEEKNNDDTRSVRSEFDYENKKKFVDILDKSKNGSFNL